MQKDQMIFMSKFGRCVIEKGEGKQERFDDYNKLAKEYNELRTELMGDNLFVQIDDTNPKWKRMNDVIMEIQRKYVKPENSVKETYRLMLEGMKERGKRNG